MSGSTRQLFVLCGAVRANTAWYLAILMPFVTSQFPHNPGTFLCILFAV
jgi:hypothetical protein